MVYGQLILENASIYQAHISQALVDQIFDFMVRDFSKHGLQIYSKPSSNQAQMEACLRMIRKPAVDEARFNQAWDEVIRLKEVYLSQ